MLGDVFWSISYDRYEDFALTFHPEFGMNQVEVVCSGSISYLYHGNQALSHGKEHELVKFPKTKFKCKTVGKLAGFRTESKRSENSFIAGDANCTFVVRLFNDLDINSKRKLDFDTQCATLVKNLFDLSGFGDFTIYCKNGEVVRADSLVLKHAPYFKPLLEFNMMRNTEADIEVNSTHLSDFSANVVQGLIEFIYTSNIDLDKSIQTLLELYVLADYTNNEVLCFYLTKLINRLFTPQNIYGNFTKFAKYEFLERRSNEIFSNPQDRDQENNWFCRPIPYPLI